MTPDKALALVQRYSELHWSIQAARARIARHLDACPGIKGKRQEKDPEWGGMSHDAMADEIHLKEWYRPGLRDDGCGGAEEHWPTPGEEQRAECPHCFAAHLVVKERKAARRQLGAVKAAMTRTTPKPAILSEPHPGAGEPF